MYMRRFATIRCDRLWRLVLAVQLVAVLSLVSNAAANPRIVPLRTSASFSTRYAENRWSVPIKSTDGRTVYVLSLVPELDVGNHITELELVLRRSNARNNAPNLLDPTGIWHGLQACDFPGRDLAQGIQKTAFGEKRTIHLNRLELVVRIAVLKVTVSPISAGDYQIDALDLQIEVDNFGP